MNDWPFALANGALCVAAFAFATQARQGAAEAKILAAFLLLNWVEYVLAWTPFKPALAFQAVGLPMDSKDVWALCDAAFGCAAMVLAYNRWWGLALWGSTVVMELIHAGYKAGWYEFGNPDMLLDIGTYSGRLNVVFLAQVAIFIMIGGRNVRRIVSDFLHRGLARVRRSRWSTTLSSARSERGGPQ